MKSGQSASDPNLQPFSYHPPPSKHIGHYTTPSARVPRISSVLGGPVHHCTRGGVRVRHVTPGQETAACRQRAERVCGRPVGRSASCPRATLTRTTAHFRRSVSPSLLTIPSQAGWQVIAGPPYLGMDPSTQSTHELTTTDVDRSATWWRGKINLQLGIHVSLLNGVVVTILKCHCDRLGLKLWNGLCRKCRARLMKL